MTDASRPFAIEVRDGVQVVRYEGPTVEDVVRLARLAAIGHESGVCRERVRQRLAKAFEKVRRELPELESHLEA